MPTHAHVGTSNLENPYRAAIQAAQAALDGLDGAKADLAVVFASADYDQQELLKGIHSAMPETQIAGCSAEGVIAQGDSKEIGLAVAVMAISSDELVFQSFILPEYDRDSGRRGQEMAALLKSQNPNDSKALLVFPDGISGNCSQFLSSLHEALPFPLLIAGGAASDSLYFKKTYQYHGNKVLSDALSAVLISGPGCFEVAVSHGCAPVGTRREVTKADAGWIYEIDGQPAWDVFKEYLHGDPQDLNADGVIHLCIGEPLPREEADHYDPLIIRTPMELNKDNGALFFPGGLQAGRTVQLTRRDQNKIKQSAKSCAEILRDRHPEKKPDFVFQFDCAGRGRVLFGGGVADEIVKPLVDTLGSSVPWIGFHTYGEIAPIASRPYYHNFTAVLCAYYGAA